MATLRPFGDRRYDAPANALNESFERMGAKAIYARNAEIYAQDDPTPLLYQVARGVVRTSRLDPDGRRQIGGFYYAGDVFGLEPGRTHRFAAEAANRCEVQTVRRDALRRLTGEAELEHALFDAARQEMERLQQHVLLLGRKTARERVGCFLMVLAQRHSGGSVDLPMSRQDMADYLGLTIETVSRMLTQLQGEAIIDLASSRRLHVRRPAALEALAA